MLDKRTRGGLWLALVLVENLVFIAYLRTYTQVGADRFVFGLPESFVVLVVFVFLVTAGNAAFGWYYLGKPDLSDLYSTKSGGESAPSTAGSEVEGP